MGEILIDLIAPPGESLATAKTFAIREGGAPMNAAVGLARLGVPVRFCGVVGDDLFGARLRALLEREGVACSALRATGEAPTSLAYAWRDERGDGQFQLLRLADRLLNQEDVARAGIDDAGALLVGSVSLAAMPSREAVIGAVSLATERGISVIVDVNVRPTLWSSRAELLEACEPVLTSAVLLKLSLDDARCLWGAETSTDAIRHADQYDPWLVAVTDGVRGLIVKHRDVDEIREYPVVAVEAVDPTGAGDAFTAALVSRLARSGWTPPTDEDILFAMAAGALATTRQGALTALPRLDDLERFLAEAR